MIVDDIENLKNHVNSDLRLEENASNDDIGSESHSDSSAYELYKILEDRHDLYNNDVDEDSSEEYEKISSGEEQLS